MTNASVKGSRGKLLKGCLDVSKDFFEQVELAKASLSAQQFVDFCLELELRMREDATGRFDHASRVNLLSIAEAECPSTDRALQFKLAHAFVEIKRPAIAIKALLKDALDPEDGLSFGTRSDLAAEIERQITGGSTEHGHALLLTYLAESYVPTPGRVRTVIEIGTTREKVPGQQSTIKIAQMCKGLGLDFVTVDMDPANSRAANEQMKAAGFPFEAITAKGEDYLENHPGPFDYIFLDAYDYDHGKHSGLRQSRYEENLGEPFDNSQCHQMHLDCARSIVSKMEIGGIVCFDDTWVDEAGEWDAKGKLAMPYLLANGFDLIDSTDTAALLKRRR